MFICLNTNLDSLHARYFIRTYSLDVDGTTDLLSQSGNAIQVERMVTQVSGISLIIMIGSAGYFTTYYV